MPIVATSTTDRAASFVRGTDLLTNIVTAGASTTLTANQAGSLVVLIAASQVTLPAGATTPIGTSFTFIQTVTATTCKILSNAVATEFLVGGVGIQGVATTLTFVAGATDSTITFNGTTKGGIVGSTFTVTLYDATHWYITGGLLGSGTGATGFATS